MSANRFDDYKDVKQVDCEDCERLWVGQCDGTHKGTEKLCNSFVATRRVIIPEQIKSLENRLQGLTEAIIIIAILVLSIYLFGWLIW